MELFNQLLAEIERIPVIDIHSRVKVKSPGAADVSQVVLSANVRTELRAAGVPRELFEIENPRRRFVEAAGRLEFIRGGTTYWMLEQILRDLYEIDAHPHECDTDEICDRVERRAADKKWSDTVLARANVEKTLVSCDWGRPLPPNEGAFAPVLRLDSLISEPASSDALDRLGEVTGQSIYEAGDLRKAVLQMMSDAADAGVVGVSAALNPQTDFEEGSRDAADRILSLALLGQKIDRADRRALRSFVMDVALEGCAEHAMPFQLMVGMHRSGQDSPRLSGFEPGLVAMYANLFARHPRTRFDVAVGAEVLAHQFTVAARAFPNVCISGCWWSMMFPTRMRAAIRERIEMLPLNKVSALFSDAGCVEWVYAACKLVRRELAFVLARMVIEGYLSEAAALNVAQRYLHRNPTSLYRLSDRRQGGEGS